MSKVLVRTVVLAAALAMVTVSAYANDSLFSPFDISDGNGKALSLDKSYHALADDPATASLQLVQANPSALNEKAVSLDLNLTLGLTLRALRVSSYATTSGVLVWSGVVADAGSVTVPFSPEEVRFDPINSVVLVKNGDRITGNVHYNGEWYKIRPLKTGAHAIVLANVNAMPPDHPESYATLPRIGMPRRPAGQAKVNTVIRVLVNYTPAAAAASGDIVGLINLAVAESNQGYANSGVFIDLALAAQGQTSYTESGSFDTDLARYRGTSDGFMDEIHATRDANAADVAVLIINNTQYCGLASGIGSTAATAFVAVYWDCATGYYSFAHEIGHLQSARHDPKNDPTTTPYAWGHGYQYTKSPSWRTIMAYNCTGLGCPRLNYWSNPNNLYNGVPMGTATKNDNHRVLNDTRATVSAFR
ncbi:MAG TPA: M12 family metallo-peptidase [Thermoanaerobaculia bacterium]